MSLFTDWFSKLEKWSEKEKKQIVKPSSLTIHSVTATIEHRDSGYYLAYKGKNENWSGKSSPIISVEKCFNGHNNAYLISTKGETDTIYFRLTI